MTVKFHGVTVTKDRLADVLKTVKQLTSQQVLVGIPAENADREPDPGQKQTPNNAVIGYVMETGEPEQNIPARPFLVPGVESAKDKAITRLRQGGEKALSGDKDAIEKTFMAVGLDLQAAVRAKINSNIQPALAPSTIEARQRRGVTRTNTLVDEGKLRDSINYVIRKKGA